MLFLPLFLLFYCLSAWKSFPMFKYICIASSTIGSCSFCFLLTCIFVIFVNLNYVCWSNCFCVMFAWSYGPLSLCNATMEGPATVPHSSFVGIQSCPLTSDVWKTPNYNSSSWLLVTIYLTYLQVRIVWTVLSLAKWLTGSTIIGVTALPSTLVNLVSLKRWPPLFRKLLD